MSINELKHGYKMSVTVVGTDAYNKFTGTVYVYNGLEMVRVDVCKTFVPLDDLVDVQLLNE